ncbi:PIG-L family deacetylase [Aequoribacter fuscus]|uniref:PIG-L deacetylase family protein n=1 Tax=Aequoribacter fuscus TaxID=2518989 RepID=UPI00059430DA|nr:PIG-L deacetylase family protein [Aequoribacter fuscus]QHJ88886.1 PIG-L family deacetylase [Aequoribacter fuscus]
MFKNILVLAPHTDDGELGAGGTINKFISQGCSVDYVAFSAAEDSVPVGFDINVLRTEVINATAALGINSENVTVLSYRVRTFPSHRQQILDDLIVLRNKKDYDLILTPSTNDIHQDHKTVTEEAIRAFKHKSILGYELIWNNLTSASTCFVKLNIDNVGAKALALGEYKSQGARPYISRQFINSLARTRGVQIGTEYAECFEVIRLIV